MSLIPKLPYVRYENVQEAQKIETQRVELLDQIQQSQRSRARKGPPPQELQEKYNRLVDQLYELERGSELLKYGLPHHVWMRIVQLVPMIMFDLDRLPGTRANPIDDVLSMCLVHEKWKKEIYREPRMWNRLVFDQPFASSSDWAKLEIALKLSGDEPIHMRSILWIHQWDVFYKILDRVADRLTTLDIDTGPTQAQLAEYSLDYLIEFIEEIPVLPSLRELICPKTSGWPVIFNRLRYKAPNLKYIEGIQLSLDAFEHEYITSSPIFPDHFISEVENNLQFGNPFDEIQHPLPINPSSLITGLPFSHTQTLELEEAAWSLIHNIPERFRGLKVLTPPSLLTWPQLHELYLLLHEIPSLRALTLTLPCTTEQMDWSDCRPCNLTSLKMDFQDPSRKELGHLKEVGEDRIHQLFEAMAGFMPYINHLTYNNTGGYVPRALWDLISRFKYFHQFNLLSFASKDELYGWKNAHISSETLVCLDLSGPQMVLVPVISRIDCPNLNHMKILATDRYEKNQLQTGTILAGVPFLTWTGDARGLPLQSLDGLTKLVIGYHHAGISPYFFLLFIHNPGNCPSLSQITFRSPPLWDLLFILLEKRNFLPSNAGISPIRSMGLPSATPYALIRPLVDLLRGRYTHRQSNFELSVKGISKLYFDSFL
jgi:hypothetical protein